MKSMKCLSSLLILAIALTLASCGAGKREAATAGLKLAEDAYNAVKGELVQYVPDGAKAVEDAIAAAKASFEQGKFAEVITAVKGIPDKVKELTAAAEAKKAELSAGWETMSAGMPQMLDGIKTKIEALAKTKKLPAGLDKAKVEVAKSGYAAATAMWEEAKAAFSGGNLVDAMNKAKPVQEKAVEAMTNLGMVAPAPPAQG
jgi:hypothetical protein